MLITNNESKVHKSAESSEKFHIKLKYHSTFKKKKKKQRKNLQKNFEKKIRWDQESSPNGIHD